MNVVTQCVHQADQLIYQTEKLLKENAQKLSDPDRAPVQAAIAKVREAVRGDDVQAIRRAISELEQASQAMAQHILSRQTVGAGARAGGNGPGGHTGQGPDDVIDADFEVKK